MRRLALSIVFASLTTLARAQTPELEKQAEQLLNSAQRAYNDGNARAAADQFNEFLQKHPGKKGTNAAKLGLTLALLDLPDPDYAKALETLSGPAQEMAFSDRPLALYYLAVSNRGLGLRARGDAGAPKFTEAARLFGKAGDVFTERKAEGDAEWAARSRCDQAEMSLRINKVKEARAAVEPFVKDPAYIASKSRPLGLYYHGFASFLLSDIPAAGKSLGLVAPFDQPFGLHARYVLGRVHHASDEKAEAAQAFDAVLAGYDKQKKDAIEALKQPERFKNDPWEKARLESLVKSPAPDYVAGASFYSAVLNYEAGRLGEALPKFQAFAKEYAPSPLAPEALLRAGFCLVQLKQFGEAAKLLKPLADQNRRLSDQALFWLGKAQFGLAQAVDPNNKPARDQAMQAALATLRTAADRAGELATQDPASVDRKADILSEIAEVQLADGKAAEAAQTLEKAFTSRPNGTKAEEIGARVVSVFQISGNAAMTLHWSGLFERKYPKSLLLPEVLFRRAEGYQMNANQLVKQRDKSAPESYQKARELYERVISKSPEFEKINRVRLGLAILHADLGDWEKAAEVIETIPAPDRSGEVAVATYLLADGLIHTAPAKADDALADNMLREKLGNAITLLEGFVAANPKAAEAPEALLKLGYCYKRVGIQLADPKEKNEAFAKSRAALDRLLKDYASVPVAGQALLERSRVRLLQGDRNGAMDDLRPFTLDPRRADPIAPLAVIAYATLLRQQNQAANAVQVMQEARTRLESGLIAAMTTDPQRGEWLSLMRFHHASALMDTGKTLEARPLFEALTAAATAKPYAVEAALMSARCLLLDDRKKLEEAEAERNKPGLKQEQIQALEARVRAARRDLTEHAKSMETRAEQFKATHPTHEARGRMHYEAAWSFRTMVPYLPLNPNGQSLAPTDAAAKDPFLKEMVDFTRAAYTRAIAANPEGALAVEARFELAEIESDLGNADVALKLLKEALDAEPADRPTSPDFADRIRFRIGAAEFERKNYDAAKAQFEAIAANPKSQLRGPAAYRAGECLLVQGKFEDAKIALKPFRDDAAFQQLPNISDRAMLRLGLAYAGVKNWESSRQVFETMLARYGNTPWKAEARYGMGWALLNLTRYDEAISQFTEVTKMKADELAGRAHLQIGLCLAAQKKYGEAVKAFMTVVYGYDAADLKFAAMLEAARCLTEDKKVAEAVKLLEKVVKDAPADSAWAKAAKERLPK